MALIKLAEFYKESISEEILLMYTSVLGDISLIEFQSAVDKIIRDPKITRMPLPANILEKSGLTEMSSDQRARLLVANIKNGIAKYGWNNSVRAEAELGETAWEAVKRSGGWQNLCETLNYENEQIFLAQLRELTKAILEENKRDRPRIDVSAQLGVDPLKYLKDIN